MSKVSNRGTENTADRAEQDPAFWCFKLSLTVNTHGAESEVSVV